MNVVLLSQNYHPMVGGIETQVRLLAGAFAERHQVTVAASNFRPGRTPARLDVLADSVLIPRYVGRQDGPVRVEALTPRFSDRLRMLPIAVRAVPRVRRYAYQPLYEFGYVWYRRVFLPRLRKLVRGADVVHGFCAGYIGWAAQEAARGAGVPYVCTPYVHPRQWGDDRANVAYYRRADAVIGLLPSDVAYLESLGVPRERLRVVGVSPDLPPTADAAGFRQRHGLGASPVVLYVGRMMPRKGAPALVAAAPLIWNRVPDTRIVFIGPGSEDETRVFRGQDRRVLYLGKVSAQEKADALAGCDVFCMPSLSEILPTVYLEAWSYAKPVVAGLAEGLRELVEGNAAGVAVSQRPEDVAGAVTSILSDRALADRFGRAGRDLVGQAYSVPAVSEALLELYEDLVQGRDARMAFPSRATAPLELA